VACEVELVDVLNQRIRDVLIEAFGEHRRVALLDFPNHSNVGDSAIYLGERTYLRRAGVKVVYSCEFNTYSRSALAQAIGDGLILLHGGGNFGDLWPEYQLFRERVIADFPNNPIVQLPQTIHFGRQDEARRARSVFTRHPQFRLLVRDQRSLAFAAEHLGLSATLCPDLAFTLRGQPRADAEVPVLWLARTDQESAAGSADVASPAVVKTDWVEDDDSVQFRVSRKMAHFLSRKMPSSSPARLALTSSYNRLATLRVRRGCATLSRGEVVVTDRLHAHILCLLLGIPHFLTDNSYGKLRSFYESWTSSSRLAQWCSSPAEAIEQAAASNKPR
jgi:pyruvyl transferase EpsO